MRVWRGEVGGELGAPNPVCDFAGPNAESLYVQVCEVDTDDKMIGEDIDELKSLTKHHHPG
jgi:hypothetical protein